MLEFPTKLIVQDAVGRYLVSTIQLASGHYETMAFMPGEKGEYNFDNPVFAGHELTERKAMWMHNRVRKMILKGLRYSRRENRQEHRIYP